MQVGKEKNLTNIFPVLTEQASSILKVLLLRLYSEFADSKVHIGEMHKLLR